MSDLKNSVSMCKIEFQLFECDSACLLVTLITTRSTLSMRYRSPFAVTTTVGRRRKYSLSTPLGNGLEILKLISCHYCASVRRVQFIRIGKLWFTVYATLNMNG